MKLVHIVVGLLVSWSCVACGDTASSNDAAANAGAGGNSGGSSAGNAGGSSTPGGTGSNGTQDDVLSQYIAATCRRFARCLPLAVPSQSDCEEALSGNYKLALEDEAITNGRVIYHPEAFPACISFLDSATCDEEQFEVCRPVFQGTIPAGKPCSFDVECEGYGQCLVNGACPGVCGPAAKLGESCSDYNACEQGLDCGGDPQAPTCQPLAKIGEACGTEIACAGYAVCVDAKCTSRSALGVSDQGGPCELLTGPSCKPGLVCTTALEADVVVGRCQPKVASGAACTFSTPDACPAGEYCHITSATGVKPATGTCQPTPKLGDECRYGTYYVTTCPSGQYCDLTTNVCTAKREIGSDCTSSTSCNGGVCVAGKCVENLECERSKAEKP